MPSLRRLCQLRVALFFCQVGCATFLRASICIAASEPGTAGVCDKAAVRAARDSGVPIDVLRAITRTETGRNTGRQLSPWPWTVNMEGKGFWFDTRAEALVYARAEHARGARSFDVGCFQINYRWHGEAFASIEEMFDPAANAAYAARFLTSLHAETGDWSRAAGAYHSRTRKYARKYRARFDRIRAALSSTKVADDTILEPRSRSDRLSEGNERPGALGSLVPVGDRGAAVFLTTRSTAPLFLSTRE